jgi:DNA-directed RNA polymerase subunit RPC12/RpoP
MDVIFNCPKCEQELAVDSSGAGSEINCPSCGELITIPEAEAVTPRPGLEPSAPPPRDGVHPVNAMASSAAAKIEMHLRVPSNKSSESLIAKPLIPLEAAAAKDADKKMRVKTIKHSECVEVGRDKFDDVVGAFLGKVGESNIVNISTLNYTHLDIATQKLLSDFAVLVVYRG